MGEMSRYYRTWEQDENISVGKRKNRTDKRDEISNPNWVTLYGPIWITGTFKRIPIQSMSNQHIVHTIRAWLGLGKTTPPEGWRGGKDVWLNLLTEELLRRNDNNRKSK